MTLHEYLIHVPCRVEDSWITTNPWQTRPIDAEHRDALAEDIRNNGLYQYAVGRVVRASSGDVVPVAEVRRLHEEGALFTGRYRLQLGMGHHRLAAYEQLAAEDEQFATFPVKVRYLTDEEMADMVMRENDARKNMTVIERARALKQRKEDFGWSITALAHRYGMSRSTASNLLRILRHLPSDAQDVVHDHGISLRAVQVLASAYSLPFEDSDQIGQRLLQKAASGANSSKLRGQYKYIVKQRTVSLNTLSFPRNRDFAPGDTPSCADCPKVISFGVGGADDRRCPDRSCREYKRSTWRRRQMEAAARVTGLPIRPRDVRHSKYTVFERPGNVADILDSGGCEYGALSLCWQDSGARCGPNVDRWPRVGYCCHHGYAGTCHCLERTRGPRNRGTSSRKKKTKRIQAHSTTSRVETPVQVETPEPAGDPATVEEDEEDLERIIETSARALARGLADLNPGALAVLYSQLNPRRQFNSQRTEGGAGRKEELLHAIARRLIDYELPYETTPASARRSIERLLHRAGVEPPWDTQEVPMEG